MRTKAQSYEKLRTMKRDLYYKDERIGRDHEELAPVLNVMGLTFEAAQYLAKHGIR